MKLASQRDTRSVGVGVKSFPFICGVCDSLVVVRQNTLLRGSFWKYVVTLSRHNPHEDTPTVFVVGLRAKLYGRRTYGSFSPRMHCEPQSIAIIYQRDAVYGL